jgi:hypothetical protein
MITPMIVVATSPIAAANMKYRSDVGELSLVGGDVCFLMDIGEHHQSMRRLITGRIPPLGLMPVKNLPRPADRKKNQ